jgi:hypothetical protein
VTLAQVLEEGRFKRRIVRLQVSFHRFEAPALDGVDPSRTRSLANASTDTVHSAAGVACIAGRLPSRISRWTDCRRSLWQWPHKRLLGAMLGTQVYVRVKVAPPRCCERLLQESRLLCAVFETVGSAATRPDCFSSTSGARTYCRGWPGHGLVREAIHGPRLSFKTHDNRSVNLRIRR